MSLTIQMKNDYSNVITKSLQKLGSGNSSDMTGLTKTMLGQGGDNTLSDYAAIKNGSYGKLLKAYYTEVEDADPQKAIKEEKDINKKVELFQEAIQGKKDGKSSSVDTTYNAMADKINSLSESVSTLFNQSI